MLLDDRVKTVPSNKDMNCIMSTQRQQQVNAPISISKMPGQARIKLIFGFKVIKIVLCTVVLALVLMFSDAYKILIKCPGENDVQVHTQIEFPFMLHQLSHERTVCNNKVEQIYFKNNFSVESGVFVAMAIASIVYIFITMIVLWKKQGKPIYLIVDGVYQGVLSALWLNSSFVWAVGLEHFMDELELDNIKHINRHICKEDGELCHLHDNVDFLLLDISVLIGFVIALVGVLIVSLICVQVFYPSTEDSSKCSHGQPIPFDKKEELDEIKLLEEGDETSTSSGSQCC